MKTQSTRTLLSLIAAGAPIAALVTLANVLRPDVALALITVASLLAFAGYDYSRRTASLRAKGRILRPLAPAKPQTQPVAEVIPFRHAA